jgi:hypothetical protein
MEESDDLLFSEGINIDKEHLARNEEWGRIAKEQARILIDLGCHSE